MPTTTPVASPPARSRSPARGLRVALWLLLLVHLWLAPDSHARQPHPRTTATQDAVSVTHSLAGAGTVDGRDYLFDAHQRRTRATEADGAYWTYNYDDRSQLTAAKRYWPDNSPIPGQQFEFAYDPIGNRTVTATGGNQSGQNLRSANSQANELNQLVSRDVPGWLPVSGEADSNAFVTVNCETPFRRGEFFHRELAVNNASSAVWQAITNTAVFAAAGPEGADIVEERRGNVFVPPATEQPAYDADGNLTTDSRWTYSWDAENRLTGMETRTNVAAVLGADFPRKKLAFTYDHQGRRTGKEVFTWSLDASSYVLSARTKFAYDGWLLLAELDATQDTEAPILTQSYLWGLDLSGTFDQAGGIGGLLAICNFQSQITSHLACSDANGNVTALVNAGSGQPSARYDYAPFGELLRASGEAAALNPFRFSTKYADAETGLIYFGYRYYSPSTGKWINRDPKEEEGGLNLYAFVGNNPLNTVDALGESLIGLLGDTSDEVSANATMAQRGASIVRRVQEAVDAYSNVQQFASMLDEIGDTGELGDDSLSFLMEFGQQAISSSLRKSQFGMAASGGGRLGNQQTRDFNQKIAEMLKDRGGWSPRGGAGTYGRETYFPPPGGGRQGGRYADLTLTLGDRILHVNTVDTYADGTMTRRERDAARDIRGRLGDNERLITIPKPRRR